MQRLIVADREQEDLALADLGMKWLASVAADRSTPLRGITVRNAAAAERIRGRSVAVYRPVTEHMVSGGPVSKPI